MGKYGDNSAFKTECGVMVVDMNRYPCCYIGDFVISLNG